MKFIFQVFRQWKLSRTPIGEDFCPIVTSWLSLPPVKPVLCKQADMPLHSAHSGTSQNHPSQSWCDVSPADFSTLDLLSHRDCSLIVKQALSYSRPHQQPDHRLLCFARTAAAPRIWAVWIILLHILNPGGAY